MENQPKVQIYKGIIQYILNSTKYNLKNIADLTDISIKNIRTIYCDSSLPEHFSSETKLVKLYHMILEFNSSQQMYIEYLSQQPIKPQLPKIKE